MQINISKSETKLSPALYVVSTPIGNLEDITLRALRILSQVDTVLCEDTRTSGFLLNHYGIKNKLISFNSQNESSKIDYVISEIKLGKAIALVSDAGTPLISDPGSFLVNSCRENEIKIIPIPGVSALITAFSVAGVPHSDFVFYGFPPLKKGRSTFLKSNFFIDKVTILYESSHRIKKLITELHELYDTKIDVVICKELTKIHENILYGTTNELLNELNKANLDKGEFVVIAYLKKT
jgi:16S rRNA (cytidine1402-2'-O)-methyltransferase